MEDFFLRKKKKKKAELDPFLFFFFFLKKKEKEQTKKQTKCYKQICFVVMISLETVSFPSKSHMYLCSYRFNYLHIKNPAFNWHILFVSAFS